MEQERDRDKEFLDALNDWLDAITDGHPVRDAQRIVRVLPVDSVRDAILMAAISKHNPDPDDLAYAALHPNYRRTIRYVNTVMPEAMECTAPSARLAHGVHNARLVFEAHPDEYTAAVYAYLMAWAGAPAERGMQPLDGMPTTDLSRISRVMLTSDKRPIRLENEEAFDAMLAASPLHD